MNTEITVVFVKCLNGCDIGSCFNHLNNKYNYLLALTVKSVNSSKHYLSCYHTDTVRQWYK